MQTGTASLVSRGVPPTPSELSRINPCMCALQTHRNGKISDSIYMYMYIHVPLFLEGVEHFHVGEVLYIVCVLLKWDSLESSLQHRSVACSDLETYMYVCRVLRLESLLMLNSYIVTWRVEYLHVG